MRLPEGMQRAIKVAKDLIYKEWKWQNNERVILNRADGPSGLNGKYREGLVFKSLTRDFSFKVISNNYLLKEA